MRGSWRSEAMALFLPSLSRNSKTRLILFPAILGNLSSEVFVLVDNRDKNRTNLRAHIEWPSSYLR
jgi:hypothetical protein